MEKELTSQQSTDDLLLLTRFKNLRLYEMLKARRMNDWSKISGVALNTIYRYLSLQLSPFCRIGGKGGRKAQDALDRPFKRSAERLANALKCSPDWIFPRSLYELHLPKEIKRTYKSPEILTLQQANSRHLLPEPSQTLDSHVDEIELRKQLSTLLNVLTPRERQIIAMRFGLEDGSEHTLEEIGQSFAVTRARIREIELKALRKLRRKKSGRKLRKFL